jgi:hypothetical protein
VIARAVDLRSLADRANPYFVPDHAALLYGAVPVVAVSACVLVLAPGLFLSLAMGRGSSAGEWLVSSLTLGIVGVSAAVALVQSISAAPVTGNGFVAVVAACACAAFAVALVRVRRGARLPWPADSPAAVFTLAIMLLAPLALCVVLLPKFLWENFNGDGAHAFESGRLLLRSALPFWPREAGSVAQFPGLTSMLFAYPTSWFIRLFGPLEVSARLPLLLYLPPLAGALLAIAGHRQPATVAASKLGAVLVWVSLSAYTVTMSFSATYNPYAADIALPATQDTLLIVCHLGFVLAFLKNEPWWMALFGVLTYASLPNGLILMGFWVVAVAVVTRPVPWDRLAAAAATLAGCVALSAVLPSLLAAAGLPRPGGEYGLVGLLRYFAFLQFTDWTRLAFLVVPAGILPALSLAIWPKQDAVARALTVVTVAYFAFFFVQANVSLHHFVPAMVLPVAVYWRMLIGAPRTPRAIHVVALLLGVVSVLVSWPSASAIDRSGREVGSALVERVGDYDRSDPQVFRHLKLLSALFPPDWHPSVPATYGGSPLVWNYYARHGSGRPASDANYVLQSSTDAPPPGMRRVAEADGAALFVGSDARWQIHRALRPPSPAGSSVYYVPRGVLFRSVPNERGTYVLDVVSALERHGFPVQPVLARLGVRR